MSSTLLSLKEIYCDEILEPHLTVNTSLTAFGTAVWIACDTGYIIQQIAEEADLTSNDTFITTCERTGQWVPAIPPCQGQDSAFIFVIFCGISLSF